jgi:hypothetical protein
MIKIVKPKAPEDLIKKGSLETKTDLIEFEANKEKYYNGELKFEAKNSIYNAESVKKTLQLFGCDWIEINVSKKGEFKKLTDWLGIERGMETRFTTYVFGVSCLYKMSCNGRDLSAYWR